MDTRFAASPDATPVAYDCQGEGPAIMLLHGGGGYRQEWHEAGYVDRLQDEFNMTSLKRGRLEPRGCMPSTTVTDRPLVSRVNKPRIHTNECEWMKYVIIQA